MNDPLSSVHHHPVRRLRQFLHPSGRTIHVAPSPEAAETLRKELSRVHGPAGEGDTFDLYIQGSEDHVRAINEARAHHEARRAELQRTHTDVFEQFEQVHHDLDVLSSELGAITEKGVSLDANFGRFGYSAHIRTHEGGEEGGSSSASSILTKGLSEEERRVGEQLKFWKKPTVRQYWHKGLIWRASSTEEVEPYELFVDLLYVGIIAVIGDRASEQANGEALLRFCVTFILGWKLWTDLTTVISWFESNDIFQRICVLIFMACLVGYTTNIENAFESTYTELISFYLAQRFFEAIYFLFIARLIPMMREALIGTTILILIGAALWIGSIHVDDTSRLVFIWIAIPFELFSMGLMIPMIYSGSAAKIPWFAPIAERMQFYPAVNIEHKTERTNAFVTLVFGYSVVALLYQSDAPAGINVYFGKAILGLIIAFSFNMLYFDIDSTSLYMHAIRRNRYAFFVWQYAHLPFVMGYALASGALAKLVVTHDGPHSTLESLAPGSAEKSESEVPEGLRWYFCAGLGVALACMGLISMTHDHKLLGGLRFRKRHRLALRFAVSAILICLPLAKSLDSLTLIATVTGLVLAVLAMDLWGGTCGTENFWWDGRGCQYRAQCKLAKKDLEAVKRGEVGSLGELVRMQKGEKGGLDMA